MFYGELMVYYHKKSLVSISKRVKEGKLMEKIKIGIVGYGNLGKGAEHSIKEQPDMELVAVFTRRNPAELTILTSGVPVISADDILNYQDKIDVLILCGGSATDLPVMSPMLAENFNIIDSYDTHATINDHFNRVNEKALLGKTVAIIGCGWDPGLFSLNRLYAEAVLPKGDTYTFWGPGLSQGHSDAIRRVTGVKAGVQYTHPIDTAIEASRRGAGNDLSTRQKHRRECFVVACENANLNEIETTIKNMPNYFDQYDTTVNFITSEEMEKNHQKMPHGGFVIRSGQTGENNHQTIEYQLKLDSNPEFTAAVLVCYARAAYKLSASSQYGAKTPFDVAPGLLSYKTPAKLREELL